MSSTVHTPIITTNCIALLLRLPYGAHHRQHWWLSPQVLARARLVPARLYFEDREPWANWSTEHLQATLPRALTSTPLWAAPSRRYRHVRPQLAALGVRPLPATRHVCFEAVAQKLHSTLKGVPSPVAATRHTSTVYVPHS